MRDVSWSGTRPIALAILLLLASAPPAGAQAILGQVAPGGSPPGPATTPAPTRDEIPTLPPVRVEAPPPISSSSQILIPGRDVELLPQGRPADILRLVPGLVIGQHAGGGKSEQYFLRGFDADHGTDVALFVDSVPVNLRSHAHGQGYADLHFLIPEVVQRAEAFKGPYFAELGDFATAGAVNFVTLDMVDENVVQAAGGSFGTQRYLALLSPTRDRLKTLIAVEDYVTDGPFKRDQHYHRINLFAKATASLGDTLDASLWGSYLRSSWLASGQVPLRSVRDGSLDRFGAIDDSEGGFTQRAIGNLDLRWRPSETQRVHLHAYAQYYTLQLFSNFTFFLNDPANGDGIEQSDRRFVAGLDLAYEHRGTLWTVPVVGTAGVQFRLDTPRVVLANQADRHRLARTVDVDIRESSTSPYVKLDVAPTSWLRVVAGARGDIFYYDVRDNLDSTAAGLTGNVLRAAPSAKGNIILGPWLRTELFANAGTGFHSNDARAVVARPDLTALPRALGYEAGLRTKPLDWLELSATAFVLELESELVFVGDDGTTEARGRTTRRGWELAGRLQPAPWLSLGGNLTVSRARFNNGDEVPLAPRLTARADVTVRLPGGFSSSFAVRHLGERFATEDRQHTARGYTLFDVVARYRYKWLEAFLSIENLFSSDYREAQFFFDSRLPNEPAGGVSDIHFTPGNPRTFLGGLAVRF